MSSHRTKSKLTLTLLASTLAALGTAAGVQAAEAPVKEILSNHIGWEVNKTTKDDTCSNNCQLAIASSEPGGFVAPHGVAVAANGNIYIAEPRNARVQELSAKGEFLAMFGEEVNKNGKNTCTANEATNCKIGRKTGEAAGFVVPSDVAVEPAGIEENIYVQDFAAAAIDKYTPNGAFIYRIGKEVNETKVDAVAGKGETPTQGEIEEENICTAASHDVCKEGVRRESESTEHTAFAFPLGHNTVTVAGVEHLLYVGDGSRIQEFKPDGVWTGEIQLPSTVTSFAIDESNNTIYAIYGEEPVIHELDLTSKIELPATIDVANAIFVKGIAISSSGYLAISIYANGPDDTSVLFGDLYKASDGRLISEIKVSGAPQTFSALGFGSNDVLYATAGEEILSYGLLPVGEVKTGRGGCSAGPERETSATFDCVLDGEVDPYEIAGTEALFEWGKTCVLDESTAIKTLPTVNVGEPISATLENVRPNEKTLCFRAVGYDHNAPAPESLAGEAVSFATPPVPPKIVATVASFATASSAVLFAELNPENAPTEYYFELAAEPEAEAKLAACHNAKETICPGVTTTQTGEAGVYGVVGATIEATDLQPATTYRYRLNAKNYQDTQEELSALSGEGTFTTIGAPVVEAATGPVIEVTQTSALVEGTVNPGGAPATYTFELGADEGAATQYDVVASGSTGAGRTPEAESFTLSGLQPGVAYAYRIAIHSGYGSAQGAQGMFTTTGLPTTLKPPAASPLLATPAITFPTQAEAGGRATAKKLTSAQKLAKALKACKAKRTKRKRVACEREARKYGGGSGKKKAVR